MLKFGEYKKLNLTLLPYKNISCLLSPLHENENEVDKGTFKGEKITALDIFRPQRYSAN